MDYPAKRRTGALCTYTSILYFYCTVLRIYVKMHVPYTYMQSLHIIIYSLIRDIPEGMQALSVHTTLLSLEQALQNEHNITLLIRIVLLLAYNITTVACKFITC